MLTVLSVLLLGGCGGSSPAAPVAEGWRRGVQTWYCGSEPSEGATATRDIVVKLTPTTEAMSGKYALRDNNRTYIGTFDRYAETGERMVTFASANSQNQNGEAKLRFSEDFKTLTIAWDAGKRSKPGESVLTAVENPSGCAAGTLLK